MTLGAAHALRACTASLKKVESLKEKVERLDKMIVNKTIARLSASKLNYFDPLISLVGCSAST